VLAAKALPGNPYDGHTLSVVIPHVQGLAGAVPSSVSTAST
jgi:hypothetical protein